MVNGNVKYKLILIFQNASKLYSGMVEIKFKLNSELFKQNDHPFFIDFQGKHINHMVLNGKTNSEVIWDQKYIFLFKDNPDLSLIDDNTLQIYFDNEFASDGAGLHYYTEVSLTYIYSNFWPDTQHKCFPGFDQPDIKGTLELHIICPQQWQAIGNEAETNTVILSTLSDY